MVFVCVFYNIIVSSLSPHSERTIIYFVLILATNSVCFSETKQKSVFVKLSIETIAVCCCVIASRVAVIHFFSHCFFISFLLWFAVAVAAFLFICKTYKRSDMFASISLIVLLESIRSRLAKRFRDFFFLSSYLFILILITFY